MDPRRSWRVLAGPGVAQPDFELLLADAPAHVRVERARPDFARLLARCAVSVSQAGCDAMAGYPAGRSAPRARPLAGGREEEQTIRAEAFAVRGLALVLREDDLTPQALAEAITTALARDKPDSGALDLGGAAATVRAVERAVADRHAIDAAWDRLQAALSDLNQSGKTLRLWWRDDDAVEPSPALERLLALAARHKTPLALAVIPALARQTLAQRLAAETAVAVLVHGWSHADHVRPQGPRPANSAIRTQPSPWPSLRPGWRACVASSAQRRQDPCWRRPGTASTAL
jgi:hypothetical protein